MVKKDDIVTVYQGDNFWVDGVVTKVLSDEVIIRLKLKGGPITERPLSDQGITWQLKEGE